MIFFPPMCTVIEIKRRERHGQELIDICDPDQSEAIKMLTGCRTVTKTHLAALILLGFSIYDCDAAIRAL